jgi:hypothetical protein
MSRRVQGEGAGTRVKQNTVNQGTADQGTADQGRVGQRSGQLTWRGAMGEV